MKNYLPNAKKKFQLNIILVLFVICGCVSTPPNADGVKAHYIDPGVNSQPSGLGFESGDIVAMTDKIVAEISNIPAFFEAKDPPRIVVDALYFKNEGSTRIDKNLITDRIRMGLIQSAKGRLFFVSRDNLDMMLQELKLKQVGIVKLDDEGDSESKIVAADYRLGGRITTRDVVTNTGEISRFHQILFELIEIRTGSIIWSEIHDFKKVAQDDVIYR